MEGIESPLTQEEAVRRNVIERDSGMAMTTTEDGDTPHSGEFVVPQSQSMVGTFGRGETAEQSSRQVTRTLSLGRLTFKKNQEE